MIELGADRYGKAAIRLVRVVRTSGGPDRIRDLTVAVALEGDFAAVYTDGDNSLAVATDTMKNTVYAFAKDHLDGSIEGFARALGEHFLEFPQVDRATVSVREHAWHPVETGGGTPAPSAFIRGGDLTRVATVLVEQAATVVEAGIEDLVIMKTAGSAFRGFPRDRYTTLPEADDRIMATKVAAIWRYGTPDVDADVLFESIRETLLEVFAEHHSPSVQTSIWLMARAIVERHDEVDEVRMALPNLHHWLVDLSPFGLENDREIFIPTTEPHGLIEATVRRGAG
jgi:urate oxidase